MDRKDGRGASHGAVGGDESLGERLRRADAALALERRERRDAVAEAARAWRLFAAVAGIHEAGDAGGVAAAVEEASAALFGGAGVELHGTAADAAALVRLHPPASGGPTTGAPPGSGISERALALGRVLLERCEGGWCAAAPLGPAASRRGVLVLRRVDPSRFGDGETGGDDLAIVARHAGLALSRV